MTAVGQRLPPRGSNGELGERLAGARREAGLTQKELAERLGVSLWRVERLESGTGGDVPGGVKSLARATGKSEQWFEDVHRGAGAEPRSETESTAAVDQTALRLVLASLTLLVVIRFFTEVMPVLPRGANFVDIPIFVVLVVAALARPSLQSGERRDTALFLVPALVFLVACAVATLANPSRVEAGPVLVFVYGYLAPVGVYLAVYRLWPVGSSLSLSRVAVGLGLLQLLVVAVVDLPRFISSQNPDEISGTFGTNQYQLVFFLLVFGALLGGIYTFERNRRIARFAPILFVAIFGTILLAQYRSLLLTTILTVLLIAALVGSARVRGLFIGVVAALAFVAILSYTAKAFPILYIGPTVENLAADPSSYVSERQRALSHVSDLYDDNPRFILTGTGPGTYASRAWQTFALFKSTSRSNVVGPYASFVTGGEIYRTDVSDKYISPRLRGGEIIEGSRALTTPYSDYSSLLAEVGVVGFVAIAFIYLGALFHSSRIILAVRRRAFPGDPLPALALAVTIAFFVLLQMGVLQSWLEVTRITFPTWILLAVVMKEFRSRYSSPAPKGLGTAVT